MSSDASDHAGPEPACAVAPEVAAVLELGAQVSEHALRRKLTPLLSTPLTVQQLRCLTILVIEGSATPHRLSDLLVVSPATTTGIIDRLVRAGMADRVPDARDGRGRVVSPTAVGQQVVRELLASDVETDAALLHELTADELAGLDRGLRGILRVLGAGGAG